MLLKDILDDELFNSRLLVKGYSNLKLFKDDKEFLLKVGLEDINTKEIYKTDYIQPELSNLFPLRSIMHKGKIEKLEGITKELQINFDKVIYKKIKDIENQAVKDLIDNLFYFNDNTYFAKYKNIVIPSFVIAQYFYFPKTDIRRIFRRQNLKLLIHEANCKQGKILFKGNTKEDLLNVIYSFIYNCNEEFANALKEAYRINILFPIEHNYDYSPTLFKFPKIDKELNLIVRGERFDNIFMVYEILNFDFSQIIPFEKIEYFFKGKKQIRTFKTHKIASKVPLNTNNISQTAKYSKDYIETIYKELELKFISQNQIKIEKVKPDKFNEYFSKKETYKQYEENSGITFSNHEGNEGFGKGAIGIDKSSFRSIKEFIETELNATIYDSDNKPEYAFIYFVLTFNDGTFREYLIVKLNRPNTAWYIFSSYNKLPYFKSIIDTLLDIKDGKSKHKSNNQYSHYLLTEEQTCFHRSLKAIEKSGDFNKWLEKLKKRILEFNRCKGFDKK